MSEKNQDKITLDEALDIMPESLKEEIAENIQQDMVAIGEKVDKQLTPAEVMKQYLADPEVIKNATHWANEFDNKFNGNWFDILKVVKKTPFKDPKSASELLQIMCLLSLCHVRTEEGKLKYKITLNPDQKIELLKQEKERLLEEYNKKIGFIDHEIQHILDKSK